MVEEIPGHVFKILVAPGILDGQGEALGKEANFICSYL